MAMNKLLNRTKGDKVIWGVVIVLSFISLLAVYSSTGSLAFRMSKNPSYFLMKHLKMCIRDRTNADDKRGMVMLQNTKADKHAYSLKAPVSFKGKVLENNLTGLVLTVDGTEAVSYTHLDVYKRQC